HYLYCLPQRKPPTDMRAPLYVCVVTFFLCGILSQVSLCVKRLIYTNDAGEIVKGVCSNFLCGPVVDLGKIVQVILANEIGIVLIGEIGGMTEEDVATFIQVRRTACKSLGALAKFSTQYTEKALDLLMDMMNDDTEAVRLQALEALFRMATYGCLSVQEKHMHM
ncbi:hypothetical protein ACJX0J_009893, partial [Zea mays]